MKRPFALLVCAFDGDKPVDCREQKMFSGELPAALRRVHFRDLIDNGLKRGYKITIELKFLRDPPAAGGKRG